MAPSRKGWSFTIHLYWDFSKSWSQIQNAGVKNSKFGVNETSETQTNFIVNTRKPVSVSEQVRHKPACTALEAILS